VADINPFVSYDTTPGALIHTPECIYFESLWDEMYGRYSASNRTHITDFYNPVRASLYFKTYYVLYSD